MTTVDFWAKIFLILYPRTWNYITSIAIACMMMQGIQNDLNFMAKIKVDMLGYLRLYFSNDAKIWEHWTRSKKPLRIQVFYSSHFIFRAGCIKKANIMWKLSPLETFTSSSVCGACKNSLDFFWYFLTFFPIFPIMPIA